MKVGLTYDLRSEYLSQGFNELETAEFDRSETIESIANALQALGHKVDRIGHCKSLVQRLANGDQWDLVFNICEGMYGSGRESQVPALLDVYQIPYTFADVLVMAACLHKDYTKRLLASIGIPTPKSMLIESPEALAKFALKFPVFAKPVAQGTSKGVTQTSKVSDAAALDSVCRSLLAEFDEPVLVEEFLPGREFTVGLIGSGTEARVLGTLEICLLPAADADVYTYRNKEDCESLVEYRLVSASEDRVVQTAEALALRSWQFLGGRDAGRIDLRCNAQGEPELIEVNPLAGLHPTHSDLPMLATAIGMEYVELIRLILESAKNRVGTCV